MGISAIGAGAPSVFVDSFSELQAAYATLSTTPGGGTIYLTSDFPDGAEIALSGGGSRPVHITSADPGQPVDLSRIALTNVDNVKVSNVHVDSTGVNRPEFERDIDFLNSSRVEITDSVFTSNGSISFDPNRGGVLGERLGMVRESEDITFEDNYFARYEQGLTFQESSEIRFADNEVTLMQGDGLRMVGVQDVMVENNYFHDFAATPNEFTHSDFIQLWSTNAVTESRDITVTGNVLDTGNGVSVQGIWMRNEQNDHGNEDYVYQNITVTNNLIYTGSANGIGVGVANNVLVEGNTLLWNENAVTVKADGDTSFQPRIRLDEDITNGRIVNNITTNILHGDGTAVRGNAQLDWSNPRDSNYAGRHFEDIIGGGDIGPDGGLQLNASSSLVGIGADTAQPGGQIASSGNTPSGGATVRTVQAASEPEPRAEPEPQADPDPAPTGPVASGPNTGAQATTLFAADFENGVADLSGFDSSLRSGSDRNIVDTPDGSGYRIGSGRMVRLEAENDQIHQLDSFGVEMEITLLPSDDVGRFLHFPKAFEASVAHDGTVTFVLNTDEGVFRVNSGSVAINDGDTHLFAVGYDDAAGKLSMSIDGTVVGTTSASGTTDAGTNHGMTVGTIWGNSVNAVVDDIFLGTDPMEAGVDLSLDEGETFDPAPPTPVGGFADGETGAPGPFDPTSNDNVPDGPDFFTTLLDIDFEDGLRDASDFNSDIRDGDARDVSVNGRGDGTYRMNDGDFLSLDRGNEQIHELDNFGLSLDIRLLDATDAGRFIHFPRAFEAVIEEDRSVSFRLDTDEGSFRVNSGETTFDDMREHTFSIGYDGDAGQLTMAIDGDVVDSVAAHGTTESMVHHGLAIGSIWGDGVSARVDNVWLGEAAPGMEVSPDAGLLHALISSAVEADPEDDRNDDDDDALAA